MQFYGNRPYNYTYRMGPYPAGNITNPPMNGIMDVYHQTDLNEALQLMVEAIRGETEDRMFYSYLLNNAPSMLDKELITGIRDDEIKHAKMFRQIYFEHTGKMIQADKNIEFEPPTTYCDGLKGALLGEQNAVKKYRRILAAMRDQKHINMLVEIMTDELRHGILYNLLIHNNDCKY